MADTSKVDAIQSAVMKAAQAAMVEYEKRNQPRDAKGEPLKGEDGKIIKNKPSREFVEKVIRSRLSGAALIEAFVEDALAGLGH